LAGDQMEGTVMDGQHTWSHSASDQRQPLMLVSADASVARADVAAKARPCPEYLMLEREYGIRLLDWSRLRHPPAARTAASSLRHAFEALRMRPSSSALLSDGENIGLPVALGLRTLRGSRPRHVIIAHHLTTPQKRRILQVPGLIGGVDTFVVHSARQQHLLTSELGIPGDRVALIRYGVDTEFWQPLPVQEEGLVVSAGREHRDYRALARALSAVNVPAHVADGSTHSPKARRSAPPAWPDNVNRGRATPLEMRHLFARASVVVVPVIQTDFPAGITVIVEAMAMGKAVIVTETEGLQGALGDPGAVVQVPVGDARTLQREIESLLGDPHRRASLGARARRSAEQHHDVKGFSAALAGLLRGEGD
jgi:glycosyltransferase involved in cell wall biosynthesis